MVIRKGKQAMRSGVGALIILFLWPGASAESYAYDARNRLTKITHDDGTSISYTYDKNGNMLTRTAKPAGPATDIDVSGEVNAVDVQLVVNGVLHVPLPGGLDPDVNHDAATNAVDVQLVINAVLGIVG